MPAVTAFQREQITRTVDEALTVEQDLRAECERWVQSLKVRLVLCSQGLESVNAYCKPASWLDARMPRSC